MKTSLLVAVVLSGTRLGPSMLDPGDPINLIANWTAYGTNVLAQDGNYIQITYSNSGNGVLVNFRATSGLTSNLIIGRRYRIAFEAKVNAGATTVDIAGSTTTPYSMTTAFAQYVCDFQASSTIGNFLQMKLSAGAGQVGTCRVLAFNEILS